ncbi:biotin-dependent carboxyltransferase family protein [Winogradskyella sp. A3E31]|uniref:5-oxoprolinase subunit C family protein n=1 Tax=Winogradskyella sp. A3E31 TaxID=3349637 RepID=UPI00398B117F
MVEILKPGFFTTIQDLGRKGYAQYGVPVSGAMDNYSARFANAILNNKECAAVLEMTMTGCALKFNIPTQIALAGGTLKAVLNGSPIELYKPISIKKGDILECAAIIKGFRTYLAIKHGFKTETYLGSRSFYQPITEKRQLLKGDMLPVESYKSNNISQHAQLKFKDDVITSKTLEAFQGPEFKMLVEEVKSQLLSHSFTVGALNNSMGYQLNESLKPHSKSILTGPVLPGTVQWTPSGQLIVLMRDCQTTGGYPRILHLTEYAINCLSQKRTGDVFSFILKE